MRATEGQRPGHESRRKPGRSSDAAERSTRAGRAVRGGRTARSAKSAPSVPAKNRRGRRPKAARTRTILAPSRRKALRRRWIALLSVLALGGLVCVLMFTPLLAVRTVDVIGAKSVSTDEIRAVAAVPGGRPLFRVGTEEIKQRVLSLPVIASADVSRSWPSTVEIEVTERSPIGYFERGDGIHLVDAAGVDFKTVKNKPEGLPQLKVSRPGPRDPSTQSVTSVLAVLPPQLRTQVVAIGAATPGSVELDLNNGKMVRWGNTEQADRKAKVLAVLLTREGKTYDVSSPELPTVS